MDTEALATGGGAAALVWLLLKVLGTWVARQRWTFTISAESTEAIARERDEARKLAAAKEAEAKACKTHMEEAGGKDAKRDNH